MGPEIRLSVESNGKMEIAPQLLCLKCREKEAPVMTSVLFQL